MCQAKAEKLFVNIVLCKNMKMVVNMKISMKLFCCLLSGGLKLPSPLVITALIDELNKQITATVLRNLITLSRKCMLLLCETHRKYFAKL